MSVCVKAMPMSFVDVYITGDSWYIKAIDMFNIKIKSWEDFIFVLEREFSWVFMSVCVKVMPMSFMDVYIVGDSWYIKAIDMFT